MNDPLPNRCGCGGRLLLVFDHRRRGRVRVAMACAGVDVAASCGWRSAWREVAFPQPAVGRPWRTVNVDRR